MHRVFDVISFSVQGKLDAGLNDLCGTHHCISDGPLATEIEAAPKDGARRNALHERFYGLLQPITCLWMYVSRKKFLQYRVMIQLVRAESRNQKRLEDTPHLHEVTVCDENHGVLGTVLHLREKL